MVRTAQLNVSMPGGRPRRLAFGGVLLAIAFALSLAFSAHAQGACMNARDCVNAANWQNAFADQYHREGVFFQAISRDYFGKAYEWGQKATFAFHAGDGTAAAWYKAIADDYSRKAVANANAADERFRHAHFVRVAAQDSANRAHFFAAITDTGPSYPEGIQLVTAEPSTPGGYNCTGTAKHIKNQRKIESSAAKTDLFSYRIETPWKFCNGKVTQLYPAEPWQTVHNGGDLAGWQYVGREKVRANCYGGTPERCAWTYQWHFKLDLPDLGPISLDRHKYPCATTQVRGDGRHYRHGGCDLRAWSGPQWG
jgi:hypothetical protein